MNKTAVITGAGSGVGRAIALLLAQREWRVALIGRGEDALKETLTLAGKNASRFLAYPCDIANPVLVEAMGKAVTKAFGEVEVLVNAGARILQRAASRNWLSRNTANSLIQISRDLISAYRRFSPQCVNAARELS